MTAIASAISADKPLSGQDHRSGPNFNLLANNGGNITIVAPQGIVFDIKEDISMHTDPTPVSSATNGTSVSGKTLAMGKNYYIANPKNASGNFTIQLTQS
jgi:hypothetical protein